LRRVASSLFPHTLDGRVHECVELLRILANRFEFLEGRARHPRCLSYEVRSRRDHRGVHLICDALPFFFPKLRSAISVEQVEWEAPACFPTTLKTFLQHYASLESFLKAKWKMMRRPKGSTIRTKVYEIRPRADKHGVDLVGDALPYSPMWYRGPKAITDAIDYAKFRSPSRRTVIRVYDEAGNVIETHEHKGEFKEW
jgi:hypothetical protein